MCLRVGAVKSVYKITVFFFFSFSSLALRDFTSDIRKKKTVRKLLWSWQQNTNCLDLFVLLCVASVGRQSNHSEVLSTINYSISELALMSLFLDFHFSFFNFFYLLRLFIRARGLAGILLVILLFIFSFYSPCCISGSVFRILFTTLLRPCEPVMKDFFPGDLFPAHMYSFRIYHIHLHLP